MYKEKSIKINALFNGIRSLMSILFPLITFPYCSRILGPESIGKLNFSQSIISIFTILAGLGITPYAIREAAKVREDKKALSKLVLELLTINIISTFIAYILFFSSILFIPKLYDYRSLLILISLQILFTTIGMDWFYNALEEFSYIAIRSVLFQILSLIFMFLFVKTESDLYIYALITVFASVGSNFINILHSRKYINYQLITLEIKKHLKPICILFFMTVMTSVYTILDNTMLGFLSSDYYVGLYTAASKINKIVITLITSVTYVLLPRLSNYIEKNNIREFNKLVNDAFEFIICFAFPCVIGLSVIKDLIIYFFAGENFFNAISIMTVLNPIILIVGVSSFIASQVLIPLNKEKHVLLGVSVGAIINFSLNIILIRKFQAVGAAVSSLIAEFIVAIVLICMVKDIIDFKRQLKAFFIYGANSIIMGVAVVIVRRFISNNLVAILCSVLIGFLIYLLLLLIERNDFVYSFFVRRKKNY